MRVEVSMAANPSPSGTMSNHRSKSGVFLSQNASRTVDATDSIVAPIVTYQYFPVCRMILYISSVERKPIVYVADHPAPTLPMEIATYGIVTNPRDELITGLTELGSKCIPA
jgi:hypothetical protein